MADNVDAGCGCFSCVGCLTVLALAGVGLYVVGRIVWQNL